MSLKIKKDDLIHIRRGSSKKGYHRVIEITPPDPTKGYPLNQWKVKTQLAFHEDGRIVKSSKVREHYYGCDYFEPITQNDIDKHITGLLGEIELFKKMRATIP